jgi:type VI secretion system secreted protein VgrG
MPSQNSLGSQAGSAASGGGGGGGGGSYTQTGRPLMIHTPLGTDKLLLVGFSGLEAISRLFTFHLQALADIKATIAFDQLIGKPVTACLQLPDLSYRYFNGIATKVSEGGRDKFFIEYSLEIVPQFWLLTRTTQYRTFQQITVPDILKKVLANVNVSYKLQGKYDPRDYCVQYRESDFNFASRLMEEEGIYYYFEHSDGSHQMVVSDTPSGHAALPTSPSIIYEGMGDGTNPEDRIYTWTKSQHLRSGKSTLWDHCLELPSNNLQSMTTIQSSVDVGTVTHNLQAGNNSAMELYDFPGHYAQRFDGVAPGSGDRDSDVQNIFTDNTRTVGIRMQEEAFSSIQIQGRSDCRQMNTGHKFTLTRHPNANGDYVLHTVAHGAELNAYRTGGGEFHYSNSFSAFPFSLPFRPARVNKKPTVYGTQTAIVVGPSGQEIFTDKYGRVKVQFRWDREGKFNADSSCWVRVCQPTAGNRWGSSFWPRIGQDVLVDFVHGDPDMPIIVGTVYDATQMPPYLGDGPDSKHTNDNKVSGFKTCSTMGGGGYNELRFDDTKGSEEIYIHGERNLDIRIEEDMKETVGNNLHVIVGSPDTKYDKTGNQMELVYNNKSIKVNNNHDEEIDGAMKLHVVGTKDVVVDGIRKHLINADDHLHVTGNRMEQIDGNTSLTVSGDQQEKISGNHLVEASSEIHLKAGTNITLECTSNLTLMVGSNFISITPQGITIAGMPMVNINSGGSPGSGTPSSPTAPSDAAKSAPVAPTVADTSVPGNVSSSSSSGANSQGGSTGAGSSGGGAAGAGSSGGGGAGNTTATPPSTIE